MEMSRARQVVLGAGIFLLVLAAVIITATVVAGTRNHDLRVDEEDRATEVSSAFLAALDESYSTRHTGQPSLTSLPEIFDGVFLTAKEKLLLNQVIVDDVAAERAPGSDDYVKNFSPAPIGELRFTNITNQHFIAAVDAHLVHHYEFEGESSQWEEIVTYQLVFDRETRTLSDIVREDPKRNGTPLY